MNRLGLSPPLAWALVLGASLALSLASLLYRTERLSGTGTHVSRGFPRSWYFTWSDNFQAGSAHAGVNWFYFLLNWLVWALVAGAVLWLAARRRADAGS